jgi:hypothetical protein
MQVTCRDDFERTAKPFRPCGTGENVAAPRKI